MILSTQTEADLRAFAKRATLLALIAVVIVAAALLAALDALTLIEPFARAVSTSNLSLFGQTLVTLLSKIAPLVPVGFYLLAVLGAVGILDHIARGEYFSARNIRALSDMGGSMLFGAGWAAFLVPVIGDWSAGRGGYRVDFSPEVLVIFAIGICLLAIGRLFLRARQLEAAMAEIV